MLLNPSLPDKDIVRHFIQMGFKERTIRDNIRRIKDGISVKKLEGSGRPKAIMTSRIKDRMVNLFDGSCKTTIKMAARKFKVSHHVIKQWLQELGIERKVRKKIPKSTDKRRRNKL